MFKKALLFLTAATFAAGQSFAQSSPCGTDQMHRKLLQEHPEIAVYEAQLEQQFQDGLKHLNLNQVAAKNGNKKTGDSIVITNINNGMYYETNDTGWYDIPIVVHIVHDYGAEYVTDDQIFTAFNDWNKVYATLNQDTANVIPAFKKYIGHPHLRLHLATIDPYGNPTKGITRHRSYLTYGTGASSQSKMDDWPPTAYVNIWFVNQLDAGSAAAAYALLPSDAASEPFYDGIISFYSYMNNTYSGQVGKTINHEMGHVFNLQHPWGNTNNPEVACGDDAVDDTPPTKGHNPQGCNTSAQYDSVCAQHYFKIYPFIHHDTVNGQPVTYTTDSLQDYPDTANSQNIMDYTYCAEMFTKGQVERMHTALRSDIAGRNNLWSPFNLQATGALAPRPDLAPIPAYSAYQSTGVPKYFTAIGTGINFKNFSWNDTISQAVWTFPNGTPSTRTDQTIQQINAALTVKFSTAGWQHFSLAVTGNGANAGTTVTLNDSSIYVADSAGMDPNGYFEEFNVTGNSSKWPMFNYYNNSFKWQNANTGYYDNTSVMYQGFDTRVFPANVTGSPRGDFDDLFSPAFNLSSFQGGPCNLDFMYSGASRTNISNDLNDTLEIDYSTDLTSSWHVLKYMTKAQLVNKGALSVYYVPLWMGDWSPMTVPVPAAAISGHTIFRFRYKPGLNATWATTGQYSTGNNFYMDRFSISSKAAGVNNIVAGESGFAVAPNPTTGNAYVIVKNGDNNPIQIRVTDITGKTVFTTAQTVNAGARVEIPKSAITVKGMYLVQIVSEGNAVTEKLVVE
jgi:hypothetical protein